MPNDETITKTKQKFRDSVESGKYSLGELIAP